MKYESVQNLHIPKIGFGTAGIGGEGLDDHSHDEKWMKAFRSALNLGYTHFDTAESYAIGHAEQLLGQAIRETGTPREGLFITTKVSPSHLRHNDVLNSCAGSLRRLGVGYLDLYLIHWPAPDIDLAETFRALNQLVRQCKVLHLGVSNFDVPLLKKATALSETPLLTDQVPYSLAVRTYENNGVLEYCQQNDVLLTAYTPVNHATIMNGNKLRTLAERRKITPQQVALAWLVSQPRVITIPMSTNHQHQVENLQAADIPLNAEEIALLG